MNIYCQNLFVFLFLQIGALVPGFRTFRWLRTG